MNEIGTTIRRYHMDLLQDGDTARCTAVAQVTPGSTVMNIGCQRFDLTNLLRNGGSIGEYNNGTATVTFVGTMRDGYMRVPFHDTPQSTGNLDEYVREAVIIEPTEAPPTERYVRERVYGCDVHGDHFFMVTADPNGTNGEALVTMIEPTRGHGGYTTPSRDGFVRHPQCRPVIGASLGHALPGHGFSVPSPRLHVPVAEGQLIRNATYTG